MYDLIDRPVMQLAPGGRFLVWAMRGWIQSATRGHCPPGALAPAFTALLAAMAFLRDGGLDEIAMRQDDALRPR